MGGNKLTNWRKKDTWLVVSCVSVWFPFSGELSTLTCVTQKKEKKTVNVLKEINKKTSGLP
jgi:hypothetical protein